VDVKKKFISVTAYVSWPRRYILANNLTGSYLSVTNYSRETLQRWAELQISKS
jgi:hypothetical protein